MVQKLTSENCKPGTVIENENSERFYTPLLILEVNEEKTKFKYLCPPPFYELSETFISTKSLLMQGYDVNTEYTINTEFEQWLSNTQK